jgi:hypothetical protein
VPDQGRRALACLSVPDLDGLVVAPTCYLLAVWAPGDGPDPAISDEMIQHTKQLRQGKKIRWEKKNLTNLSARSELTGRSRRPTDGSFCQSCRTQEAELDPLQPPKAPSHALLYRLLPKFFGVSVFS